MCGEGTPIQERYLVYRGTSFTINCFLPGPYRKTMPGALGMVGPYLELVVGHEAVVRERPLSHGRHHLV